MARHTKRSKRTGNQPDTAANTESPASEALTQSKHRNLPVASLLDELAARPDFLEGIHLGEILIPEPLRTHGQWVVRSDDFLSLHLELTNLRVQPSAGQAAELAIAGPGEAYLALHFAPQAIAERVFFAASPNIPNEQDGHVDEKTAQPPPSTPPTPLEPLAPPPIGTRIANPSRLVFKFDEDKLRAANRWPVPYTLSGILNACRVLNLNVTANARYVAPSRVAKMPRYHRSPLVEIRDVYTRLGIADKSAVLTSAQRNQNLARRLGGEASVVLRRRGDLPYF